MKLSPQDEFTQAQKRQGSEHSGLMARIAGVEAISAPKSANMEEFTALAVRRLSRMGNQSAATVNTVASRQSDAATPLRQFIFDNGLKSPARKPNPVKTILTLQAGFVVEAGATAALLTGDGTMGMVPALLTGTIFAGTNIALGAAAGFFPLRGMAHKNNAPEPKRKDAIIRGLCTAAFTGFVAVMAGLHFAAARVRVLGNHTGIWDFETVSFAGTFADYYAIALITIGGLSSLLAVHEGRNSISDPVWGYSELTNATEDRIRNALDQALTNSEDQLEAALNAAVDTVETSADTFEESRNQYLAEINALREDVGRFNADVKQSISSLKAAHTSHLKRRQYLAGTGRKVDPMPLDLAALRGMLIDENLIPASDVQPPDPDNLIARLEAAFEDACAKLSAAYTTATSFITLPFFE